MELRTFRRLLAAHGRRLVLYAAVGLSGVALNTGALWALVSLAGFNHLLAAAISSELSILSNFLLNDRFTFADHRAPLSTVHRAARYNAVALSGTLFSLGVLAMLTLGAGTYYLLANLAAMGVSTLWNYALNMRFTWSLHVNPPMRQAEVPL